MADVREFDLKFWNYLLLSFVFNFCLGAIEISPWFGKVWEFGVDAAYSYQKYESIDKEFNDRILDVGLSISPLPRFWVGTKVLLVDSSYNNVYLDSFVFSGCYQLLDDVVGDPISMVAGTTIALSTKMGCCSIGAMQRANTDFEGYIILGKEISSGKEWHYHTWTSVGYVLSDKGSPAFRVKAAIERNIHNQHRINFFGEAFYGLGKNEFNNFNLFKGYSSLNHQSIDIGAGYTYNLGYGREISAKYKHRLHSRSSISSVNCLTLNYFYTFPLV